MREVLLAAVGAPLAVLVGAAVVAALDAVLDARGAARWTSVAAPASAAARALRRRHVLRPATDLLLVVVAVLQLAALLVDPPGGVLWVLGLTAVAAAVGTRSGRVRAVAALLPLAVAVASPVAAARSLRLQGIAAAQTELWFAVEMPVAALVLLVALAGVRRPGAGAVGRAALLVPAAALIAALLAGGLPSGTAALAAVVALVLLVLIRRGIPAAPPAALAATGRRVLLPLALVQLAVVVAVRAAT